MKKNMVSQLHMVTFMSLSVTEKSNKDVEMQHQEVKSHSPL